MKKNGYGQNFIKILFQKYISILLAAFVFVLGMMTPVNAEANAKVNDKVNEEAVVSSGTGYKGSVSGYTIAGKTGTSEDRC